MTRRRIRKPYRAALIGCGRVGFMLERDALRPRPCTHAGGVTAHPDFELAAGCDIQPERIEDFGRTYGISGGHLYRDAEELIDRESPDLLCIATWTQSHDEIVRKACRAGIPAVICEKPMAVTYARAKSMVAAARRSGTMLIINHSRRWSPEYRTIRRAVREKRYGELRHIQGCVLTSFGRRPLESDDSKRDRLKKQIREPNWHAELAKSGGGPLLHDGTHLIDIVLYITGLQPAWVEGRIERSRAAPIERRAVGRMSFRGTPDLEFHFEAGGARQYFHFEVELWFDAGRITVGNGIRNAETSVNSRRYSGFEDLSVDGEFEWDRAIGTAERVEMEELSQWFSGGPAPANTAVESLDSQAAIFATYESAVRDRRIHFPYRPALAHPLMVRSDHERREK